VTNFRFMSSEQLKIFGLGHVTAGFSLFGLLVGYICGLTSSPVANAIILALFSFLGGKLFQDINNNDSKKTKISGVILAAFSLLFFIGLNLGIIVKVNEFLTFKTPSISQKVKTSDTTSVTTKVDYLRNTEVLNDLEAKFRRNELTSKEKEDIIAMFFAKTKK
jgi:hypothetical protein